MRNSVRIGSLAMSVLLLSQSGASGQKTEVSLYGGLTCEAYCAGTSAACVYVSNQMGSSLEYCAGWLEGCLAGCKM